MSGQQNEIRRAGRAAVADALASARGWLRQPSREAVADAVVAAVEPLIRADERRRLAGEAGRAEPGTIAWIDDGPDSDGFICAVPLGRYDDCLSGAICGEPVGAEACPEHGTYAGETP